MYGYLPDKIAVMSKSPSTAANWGIEIEHDGSRQPDYFAVESMVFDDDGIHLRVVDGTSVEYAPGSVRRILVLRTKEIVEP